MGPLPLHRYQQEIGLRDGVVAVFVDLFLLVGPVDRRVRLDDGGALEVGVRLADLLELVEVRHGRGDQAPLSALPELRVREVLNA